MSEETPIADLLRQAREQKDKSLDAVNRETKISLNVLHGFEAGQFDVVELVYARMALSEYAEYLGLDAATLLQRFDREFTPAQPLPPTVEVPPPKRTKISTSSFTIPPQLRLAALGVLGLALIFALVLYLDDEDLTTSQSRPDPRAAVRADAPRQSPPAAATPSARSATRPPATTTTSNSQSQTEAVPQQASSEDTEATPSAQSPPAQTAATSEVSQETQAGETTAQQSAAPSAGPTEEINTPESSAAADTESAEPAGESTQTATSQADDTESAQTTSSAEADTASAESEETMHPTTAAQGVSAETAAAITADSEADSAATESTSTGAPTSAPTTPAPLNDAEETTRTAAAPAETADASGPAPAPATTANPTATTDTDAAATNGDATPVDALVQLTAEATDSTWVEITRDGQVIYSAIVPAGQTRSWRSSAGFLVRSGHPHGIRYSFQGQRLGDDGHLGPANRYLRFRVSDAGVVLLNADLQPLDAPTQP